MIGETVYVVYTNYVFGPDCLSVFSTYDKAIDYMWKSLDETVYNGLNATQKAEYGINKKNKESFYSDDLNFMARVEEYTVKQKGDNNGKI